MFAINPVIASPKASTVSRPTRASTRVMAIRKPSTADFKHAFNKKRGGPLDDIGGYVSEAFAQIFSGLDEAKAVPWIEQPAFSGTIAHHEAGSHHSSRFNDGGYPGKRQADAVQSEHGVAKAPVGWVTETVGRSFFGTNIDDSSSEPHVFYSTGYTGRKFSARRIRREVDRLGRH